MNVMSRGIVFLSAGTLLLLAAAGLGAFLRKDRDGTGEGGPRSALEQPVGNPSPSRRPSPLVDGQGELSFLRLPQDFSIGVFARDLPGARVLAFDPEGNMLVSLMKSGRVAVVRDTDGDGSADETRTLLSGLDEPHGLAFDCERDHCWLYVAETGRVMRYDYDSRSVRAVNGVRLFDLPFGNGHATRTLLIAPVNGAKRLFVHVGSSCNVCVESDPRRATILSANLDGSDVRVFASGLRNSVFFAAHPMTGEIWATDNGRDRIGDDVPPDEINIVREGRNYGWPYCYGKNVHDDSFDSQRRHACAEPQTLPSHIDIQAHSAALGLAFASGDGWPQDFRNNLFVAYHGSWNRTVPTGYKVVRYRLDEAGKYLGQEDFITGWLDAGGTVRGRPVAILARPDGVLYVSDDKAGMVYRINFVR
jgi:glucose/arabinose dehydrogenase